jgi:transcriptional regulator with XRE-family HTH domain/regulation of enolase protein 1 (concanavalin A-like superfamily)
LAERVKVSSETISRWENGASKPQPQQLRKLCEVLEKPPEALGYPLERVSIQSGILSSPPVEQMHMQRETPLPYWRRPDTIITAISDLIIVLLILVVASRFVSFPTLISPGCGGAFSDEFHGKLASGWTPIDFSGSTTYHLTATGVSLSTSANSDLNPHLNLDAPRLLQPITGNFTIQTGLQFSPNANFQSAGILLWQDQTTFMRFERGFGGKKSGVFIQMWDHGTLTNVSGLGRHPTTAGSVELRIQRQGDHFTASWRVPGQTWQTEGEADLHFEHLQVGVDLIADYGAPQITVTYNYFNVSCA